MTVLKSDCQIIPSTAVAFCESFSCTNRVSYAIGVLDGPIETWHFVCEKCLKTIIESVPNELMPVKLPMSTDEQRAMAIELVQHLSEEEDEGFLTAFMQDILEALGVDLTDNEPQDNEPEQPGQFICEHCNRPFKSNQALVTHQRYCKEKEG